MVYTRETSKFKSPHHPIQCVFLPHVPTIGSRSTISLTKINLLQKINEWIKYIISTFWLEYYTVHYTPHAARLLVAWSVYLIKLHITTISCIGVTMHRSEWLLSCWYFSELKLNEAPWINGENSLKIKGSFWTSRLSQELNRLLSVSANCIFHILFLIAIYKIQSILGHVI